ncbi:MAG: toxic anion resistance protein [Methylococcaceae bacterium]|nr:toxic anion resistance protein [Methylococcaceae bacterium]
MNEPTSTAETLTLTPPEPVKPVTTEQATGMVKLDQTLLSQLDVKVQDFVEQVVKLDAGSPEFIAKVNNIHALANEEIRSAANISNRLLERPVSTMKSGGMLDSDSTVSKTLLDLRKTIESLDPTRQGDLLTPRKLFGILPFGNNIQGYFRQYQSAQTHLNAIIQALYRSQDELRKDNAALEQEKLAAWEIMQKLEQYVYLGKKLDAELEAKLALLEFSEAEKVRVIKEEMQFYLRQKVQDMLTQLAVTIQGYLAMDLVRKNNLELIKGVDRATTTTISALRTAVIVCQALANQKLVLDQISALNTTTSNLIESTSGMLKQQAGQIHQQAASSTVQLDKLQKAFQNIYDTMDMVANYKLAALDSMKTTVDTLSHEVEKSKSYLDRVRAQKVQETVASLPPPGADLQL